jgi:Fe2+ or Zn2+ uptake regulation protein
MLMTQWRLAVHRAGRDSQVELRHDSGLCRGWSGDIACRMCHSLGLDSGERPCPKAQAWRLFLLAHAFEAVQPTRQPPEPPPSSPPAPPNDDPWGSLLREHGLKPTAARRRIAGHVLGHARHVTAEQLATELDAAGYACSPNTIRRTLAEFVHWDLLQLVDVGGGTVFYDSVTAPHAHIYNVDTGELSDLAPDQAWITGLPELPAGLRLEAVQLVFRVRETEPSRQEP